MLTQERYQTILNILNERSAVTVAELSQLLIEEADVELSIVNDESGALNKFNELVGDVRKLRLTDQKFIGDLVDADNLCLHLAFRIDVLMKIFIG